MKVLIIRTFANVVNPASYNLQEIGLAKALVKRGHSCDIVYYSDAGDREEIINVGDGFIRIFWRTAVKFLHNALYGRIDSLIKDYDVVQVSEYDQLFSRKLYRAMSNVVLFHGPYRDSSGVGAKGIFSKLLSEIYDATLNNKGKNSTVSVISKSPLATKYLRSKGFKRIRTLGVGLDDSLYAESINPIDSDRAFNLISVGRLSRNKNTGFLLDVFDEVIRVLPDTNLYLIGDGDDKYASDIKRRVLQDPLRSHVTYIPWVSQVDIPKYYLCSDLMIFPSDYDIFGMVLLESGYFGCPFVTSMNGGASMLRMDGDCGEVIDEFDISLWVDAIISLLNNPELRKQKAKCLQDLIKRRYVWNQLATEYIAVYEDVAKSCTKAPPRSEMPER